MPRNLIPGSGVIILRFNHEEMELDDFVRQPLEEAKELMTFRRPDGKLAIPMSKYTR